MNIQAKDKQVIFRLEERYMEELERRADELGMKPNLFARMLVVEALEGPLDNLLLEQIDDLLTERLGVLEKQFNIFRNQILELIKESFSVIGNVDREDLDKIIPAR